MMSDVGERVIHTIVCTQYNNDEAHSYSCNARGPVDIIDTQDTCARKAVGEGMYVSNLYEFQWELVR